MTVCLFLADNSFSINKSNRYLFQIHYEYIEKAID